MLPMTRMIRMALPAATQNSALQPQLEHKPRRLDTQIPSPGKNTEESVTRESPEAKARGRRPKSQPLTMKQSSFLILRKVSPTRTAIPGAVA